jgi:hypothetical protein
MKAILADLLGLSVSTGMVAKTERIAAEALADPVEAVYEHLRAAAAAVPAHGIAIAAVAAWMNSRREGRRPSAMSRSPSYRWRSWLGGCGDDNSSPPARLPGGLPPPRTVLRETAGSCIA